MENETPFPRSETTDDDDGTTGPRPSVRYQEETRRMGTILKVQLRDPEGGLALGEREGQQDSLVNSTIVAMAALMALKL